MMTVACKSTLWENYGFINYPLLGHGRTNYLELNSRQSRIMPILESQHEIMCHAFYISEIVYVYNAELYILKTK